jgi:hypothetical protein
MKKIVIRATVLIMALLFSGACSNSDEERARNQGQEIWFEETVHEYGDVFRGGDGSWTFVFKNVGEKAIVVNRVRSTCGCTVPEWSREPVEPGKKGKITVIYNTAVTGTFVKSLYVYSSAVNSPVKLQIKGKVIRQEN